MGEFQAFLSGNKISSRADEAYEALKTLILEGEIKPGELIRESEIAEYLKMSRTPVREAVRRLEAEEVLLIRPGMGSFLKYLSPKEMRDIFEVRMTLELIASRTAVRNITSDEIAALRREFAELEERYRRNRERERGEEEKENQGAEKEAELARFNELDGKVHDLILERCENGYVKILAGHIYFKAARYRVLSFRFSTDMEESIRRHLELLDAFESRDGERIAGCIREHIRWSERGLLEHFSV